MHFYLILNNLQKILVLAFLILISSVLSSSANPLLSEKVEIVGATEKGEVIINDYKGINPDKIQNQTRASLVPSVENMSSRDSASLHITTVAAHLDVPWEIVWGPDDWIWFTEQSGAVSRVNPETGEQKLLLRVLPDVFRNRTLGLLSMALHPDMENFPYVFLNYTYLKGTDLLSRWLRYTYDGKKLVDPLTLFEIPAAAGHNGSRIVFSPDGKLILATGDADPRNDEKNAGNAQDLNSLSGKILRLNIDGSIPEDNPFPGSPIWALGFRVPQGLVYAANGKLYSAEHGHTTNDEVNLIQKGANYGYPRVLGACDEEQEEEFCETHQINEPLMAWTPTIAPAGLDYYNHPAIPQWQNSLLLLTLRNQSLRVLKLNDNGNTVVNEQVYFEKRFGRLRDICISPEGDVYISTSNRDWNPMEGFPQDDDDRIIKISAKKPSGSPSKPQVKENTIKPTAPTVKEGPIHKGALVYNNYCASCHKPDGTGITGTFPPLKGAEQVQGDKKELIGIVLHGLTGPITVAGEKYDMEMPAFDFLSDQEVADVVEYIRLKFADIKEDVTPVEVKQVRAR